MRGLRLLRQPTLAAELRQAVVYASVPVLMTSLAAWAWMRDPASVPGWFTYVGVGLGIVLLTLLWNVAAHARRVARGSEPVIEVSAVPVQPGQPFQLRVVDEDAAGVESVEVFLIAEDVKVEQVRLTTVNGSAWRFTEVVRHQVPVLSASKDALRMEGHRLDRTVTTQIPAEFTDRNWRWAVLVVGPVGRGMPRVDRYPLATG